MSMTIVQVRKSVKESVEVLRNLKENMDLGELEKLIEEIDTLKNAVEENLDKINEKDNLNEREETRQSQYEELLTALEDLHPDLEEMKEALESLEEKADMLEAIEEQVLSM